MLISASIAAVVMLGVFLYLVQSGWFARMKRGFLTSLILAVAGSNIVVNRTPDQRIRTDRLRVHAHVIPVDEGRDHCA